MTWPPLSWMTLKGLAGGYRWRGPVSDHFDGERFSNPVSRPPRDRQDYKRWRREHRRRPAWQWQALENEPDAPAPRVGAGEMRITLVNHATFLIQLDGFNLLTDPVWSTRVSPFAFAGPARFHPPGLGLEQLPPLDAVFLSHNHYDHCDIATLRRLAERHPQARAIAGLGNRRLLREAGFERVDELDWWQSVSLSGGLHLTFTPAQHWSARSLWDARRTLWGGMLLESGAGRLYYAGDTAFEASIFEAVRERLGVPRVALLPIGAYRPEWFMSGMHMGPQEAVTAHQLLGSDTSIACHFGCFSLADEGQQEAQQALIAAREAAGLAAQAFRLPEPGRAIVAAADITPAPRP